VARITLPGKVERPAVAAFLQNRLGSNVQVTATRRLRIIHGKDKVDVRVVPRAKGTKVVAIPLPPPWAMPFMSFGALGGLFYGMSITKNARGLAEAANNHLRSWGQTAPTAAPPRPPVVARPAAVGTKPVAPSRAAPTAPPTMRR
jgi:hypothetical protein